MANADLLTRLIQHSLSGDKARVRAVIESIIAEERSKQHIVLADRLESLLRSISIDPHRNNGTSFTDLRVESLVTETVPRRRIGDLILSPSVVDTCSMLVQEHRRKDLLRAYNLEPRNRVLLVGPPGNGKTSLAEAIAESLILPLLTVRYDSVIGPYLGETANRLRRVIEFACTRACVLFFDEFETLGKERGDTHETGEIKRVVSSLLLQIDSLPSHVMVIAATNHPELLDRAAWRRFQVKIELPPPTRAQLIRWADEFAARAKASLGCTSSTLADRLEGLSFSEVEEFGQSILRGFVLGTPDCDMKSLVSAILRSIPSGRIRRKGIRG